MLRGLDLILPRGTITAVVGRSGAGKSTVASLISRFYEPDSGAIWLGGRPATDFTRGEWAKAVALVSQEPVLFSGTSVVKTSVFIAAPAMGEPTSLCYTHTVHLSWDDKTDSQLRDCCNSRQTLEGMKQK